MRTKMYRITFVIVLVTLLAACALSQSTAPASDIPTASAAVTAVPLTGEMLKPAMKEGLPPELDDMGFITRDPPFCIGCPKEIAAPDVIAHQSLGVAEITVRIYNDAQLRDQVYKSFEAHLRTEKPICCNGASMEVTELSDIGEQGLMVIEVKSPGATPASDQAAGQPRQALRRLLIRQCRALIYIFYAENPRDPEAFTSYARGLVARLKPLVC